MKDCEASVLTWFGWGVLVAVHLLIAFGSDCLVQRRLLECRLLKHHLRGSKRCMRKGR